MQRRLIGFKLRLPKDPDPRSTNNTKHNMALLTWTRLGLAYLSVLSVHSKLISWTSPQKVLSIKGKTSCPSPQGRTMMMPGGNQELSAQEKINQEWNGMAGEWDDLAGPYATGFYKLLWEHTGLDPNDLRDKATIVDFGCGTGLLTAKLRTVAASVVGIDASPRMIDMMEEKILSRGWDNVKAFAVVLGNLSQAKENTKKNLEELEGKVDLIVASSVLSFIPNEDIEATMKEIGRLLKPGGVFCHSDWPKSEAKHPDAMTEEKAARYFAMAGLNQEVGRIVKMDMGTDDQGMEVFVGVARKP